MRLSVLSAAFVMLLTFICLGHASAQPLDGGFRSRYSSAVIFTPINTAFDIVPNGRVDLLFSLSAESSFRSSEHLAYVLAGGYYPYDHRTESLLTFSLRAFSAQSEAPTGTFFDGGVIAGFERDRVTEQAPAPETLPMFGVGLRVGGLRNSRFNWFAFEYGAGTSLVFVGGQPQFRAQLFFGLGFLLGREVLVN